MPNVQERPPTTPKPRRRRGAFVEGDDDNRSVLIGLLLTIIVWPLLVWLMAFGLRHLSHGTPGGATAAAPQTFEIELTPEETVAPQPTPPPDRFVEANPDAPENVPDKTRNFSDRNQQVAQEKPTPEGASDTPALDGKEEKDVTQIVSGQLQNPEEPPPPPPAPPMPEVPPSVAQQSAPREENPLPGTETFEGENPDGIGTGISENLENVTGAPKHVDGQKDAPQFDTPAFAGQPRIDPERPLPRRRVDKNVRPAILAQNRIGTQNVGPIAIDARWSQYGEYLQKLIETVQVQWERINDQSRVYPPAGSTVTVKFRLDAAEGAVTEIVHSESTGGKQSERACITAITARSPYGKWTEDMIAVLGQSQEMTFTFHYQ